ncbi:glycosyltransferase family 2 protein [Candidatus Berkelbacteria bacterium]|nr:glycosyltransferase family 2 protein [Candidatus Berkelbacteria bacterium]
MPKFLVIVPTYNERENLTKLLDALMALPVQELEVLIVDDNSPDGTGQLASMLSQKEARLHVLHRKQKAGLGAAYAAGFAWALESNADGIITLDADFSHNPADVPQLIEKFQAKTIVIGSRYIPGGKIVGWDWQRYVNSYGANIVTKILLGLPVRDSTAGFKLYPRGFLESLDLTTLIATGYAFQVEMLLQGHEKGFRLVEIPITFVDRRVGESKISGELGRSARTILKLASQRRAWREFVKFALVGLFNTIIDWVIFFLALQTPLGSLGQLGKQIGKAFSFCGSVISSYVMNRRWTFRSKNRAVFKQAAKFFLVATLGLGLNNVIFYFASASNWLGLTDIFSLAIATGTVGFWNFFANKYWTFRR